jgi:hypothetical protein
LVLLEAEPELFEKPNKDRDCILVVEPADDFAAVSRARLGIFIMIVSLKYGEERVCVNEKKVCPNFLQREPSRRKSNKLIPPLFASP